MNENPRGPSPYVRWLLRHSRAVFLVTTLLALVAGYRTVLTYAALRSDLEELLPETAPSVAALKTLRERLPGIRHLGVVVALDRPEQLPAANRFVDALAERIRAYPKHLVSAVRVDTRAEREFAETYALQLMDPEDVKRLREAVEERRDFDVSRAMGIDLEDEGEAKPPPLPVAELRAKYEARFGKPRTGPGDRFVSPDGKSIVFLVQAGAHGTGKSADAELLERVQRDASALGFPEKFDAGLRVGYAGDVAVRVEEARGLESDLTISGLVVSLLVVVALIWFYRSARAVPILGVPLVYGTVGAFGLAALPPLSIHYLNSNTAFLGSIVVGNGINSGIMLLARFLEERQAGRPLVASIDSAVRNTWKATLAAAGAAAAAYASLIFTDFRGFNQFGWIGGIGLLVTWAMMYVLVPIFAAWFGAPLGRTRGEARPLARRVMQAILNRPRGALAVIGVLSVVATIGLVRRANDWIEYDLSKLRRRDSWESGERYWGKRMDAATGRYLTPMVALNDSAETARVTEQHFRAVQERRGAGDLISTVRSVRTFVSEERARSLDEARKLAEVLTPRMKQDLAPRDRDLVEKALSPRALQPITVGDVPESLLLGLREHSGRVDRNVLVVPKLSTGTWNAERLDVFARDLRAAAVIGDKQQPVAGSLLLSSDIAGAMKNDGPRATLLSLLSVLLIYWLTFRGPARRGDSEYGAVGYSLLAMSSLFCGVLLMLGLLAWSGEKLNFSNFVALPIAFGIGADYAINVLQRYESERRGSLARALSSTSGAVALCSAATVIGYASLLMAQNRALFSFGVFAISGELACLVTAVIALPAALKLREGRRLTGARRSAYKSEPPPPKLERPGHPSSAGDSSEA